MIYAFTAEQLGLKDRNFDPNYAKVGEFVSTDVFGGVLEMGRFPGGSFGGKVYRCTKIENGKPMFERCNWA